MDINTCFNKAKTCKLCYGNEPICVPLPDPQNGKKDVEIMFINERPGRIGPGLSGYVSFDNDDPSANHFRECFEQLRIERRKIFITNACICYPQKEGYKDTVPSLQEIKNCQVWLKQQIEIVNPKIIVTIGNIALRAIKIAFPFSKDLKMFRLSKNIGEVIKDTDIRIYPLYHTSLRARITRKAEQQKKDWSKIRDLLEEV